MGFLRRDDDDDSQNAPAVPRDVATADAPLCGGTETARWPGQTRQDAGCHASAGQSCLQT